MLKTIEAISPQFEDFEAHRQSDGHTVKSYANGRVRVINGIHPVTLVSLGRHHDFVEIKRFGGFEFNKMGEIDTVFLKEPLSERRIPVMSFTDNPNGGGYEYDVYSSGMLGEEDAKKIGSAFGKDLHLAVAFIAHPDQALLDAAGDSRIDQSVADYLRKAIDQSEKRIYIS